MGDKIQSYAFSMLLLQLSFVLIGLAGVFPFSLQIAGLDVYGDIQETVTSIQISYESIAGKGTLDYALVSGMSIIMGIKIIFEFIILVLLGAYPVMVAIGLPVSFALPIASLLGAVMVYHLSIKFMGR